MPRWPFLLPLFVAALGALLFKSWSANQEALQREWVWQEKQFGLLSNDGEFFETGLSPSWRHPMFADREKPGYQRPEYSLKEWRPLLPSLSSAEQGSVLAGLGQHAEAERVLSDAWKDSTTNDMELIALGYALLNLGPSEQTREAVVDYFASGPPFRPYYWSSRSLLCGEHLDDPKVVEAMWPYLIHPTALGIPPTGIKEFFMELALRNEQPSFESALKHLTSPDPKTKARAITLLRGLVLHSPYVADRVIAMLEDKDPEIISGMVTVLGMALSRESDPGQLAALQKHQTHANPSVAQAVEQALLHLEGPDRHLAIMPSHKTPEPSISLAEGRRLIDRASSATGHEQDMMVKQLGRLTETDDFILEFLATQVGPHQPYAVAALCDVSNVSHVSDTLLQDWLARSQIRYRLAALALLSRRAPVSPLLRAWITRRSKRNQNPWLRAEAGFALSMIENHAVRKARWAQVSQLVDGGLAEARRWRDLQRPFQARRALRQLLQHLQMKAILAAPMPTFYKDVSFYSEKELISMSTPLYEKMRKEFTDLLAD